jgi:hypothetical protein
VGTGAHGRQYFAKRIAEVTLELCIKHFMDFAFG